jgi:polyprenyl P-hydroxybenzoate/phenylacrylic acid decarboxylase-like protein
VASRLLRALRDAGVETHLVITASGRAVWEAETGRPWSDQQGEATHVHRIDDFLAPISSGTFPVDGMVVAPCSMKTLAGVAHGYADNLLLRAADVCLKERRRLVLVTRESPLSVIHLDNMRRVTEAGAVVLPPVLTFYTPDKSVEGMVDVVVGKVLDVLGVGGFCYPRWS